jgi:hypothetical protein
MVLGFVSSVLYSSDSGFTGVVQATERPAGVQVVVPAVDPTAVEFAAGATVVPALELAAVDLALDVELGK